MPSGQMSDYLASVGRELRLGNATEHTHRPALKSLVQALRSGVVATNEPKRIECGAPDLEVVQEAAHGPLRIGHVETKDVGVSLDAAAGSEQLKRYRSALPNLLLTDYLEFRWFVDGEQVRTVRVASPDGRGGFTEIPGGRDQLQDLLDDFLSRAPERISQPPVLAERMARLTDLIHVVVLRALETESSSDVLVELRRAFAEVLIPDLTSGQFADMFAQTLAYGLFAARIQHADASTPFRRVDAAREIPRTNPFLRRVFSAISGPELDDEPYVGLVEDLAQLLADTDVDAILQDFGSTTRRQDPVFHFYETYLAAYDPEVRERRGVYYTPEPVVSYITRSVDWLLQEKFGVQDGLADIRRVDDTHEVLILDPAVGTGTFLYAVIDLIRERFRQRGQAGMWSAYVREHLLPRLFGFELMMAPYAVAHLKLGLQLAGQDLAPDERASWSYDFSGDDRLGVYLTNSLQEAVPASELLLGSWISDEANAAAHVKRDLPIMVVLGNPPYSGHSANESTFLRGVERGEPYPVRQEGRWIGQRVADRPTTVRVPNFIGRLLDDYYHVDGGPLGERNPKWLQDDYVKFIRFGQWRIEQTGAGILAFVTNHSYLDNSTFRGMRQELVDTFDEIYLLDLHGNSRKRERAPDGGEDANVFDIQQGVAIALFVKLPDGTEPGGRATVLHEDLWGDRRTKYESLDAADISSTDWTTLQVVGPDYVFKPLGRDVQEEWGRAWDIDDAMPVTSVGVATHRDDLAVGFSQDDVRTRFARFLDPDLSDDAVRRESFGDQGRGGRPAGDSSTWRLSDARLHLQEDPEWQTAIHEYTYRPFDCRAILYHPEVVDRQRYDLMRHMLAGDNLGIAVGRAGQAVEAGRWNLAFASRRLTDLNLFRRGGNYLHPLYLYPEADDDAGWSEVFDDSPWPRGPQGRRPNFGYAFVGAVETNTGLAFLSDGRGDLESTFGAEDLAAYIYAVLWSPSWRERFADFLDVNPPRIPLPPDADVFAGLVQPGHDLLRLSNDPMSGTASGVRFPEGGENVVASGHPKYLPAGEPDPLTEDPTSLGRIYVAPARASEALPGQYFEGVSPETWAFEVGGHQVCDKWLRDRQGRVLSYDDLQEYGRIVARITAMREVIDEVEAAIPGWPLA